jgi:hypothetical protein
MTARLTPTEEPVVKVLQYLDAFNKGDTKAMSACFAVPGFILDGVTPRVWTGATATEDWYRDKLVDAAHSGVNDYFATLGSPLHFDMTADSAYVLMPASITFNVRGEQVTQSGAIFSVALRRFADEWRIAAWAWAKGKTSISNA